MLVSKYYSIKRRLLFLQKSASLRLRRFFSTKEVKTVKLVAIARNESAYLLEWIFHHLYVGFSEIDIYYNRCSDNTADLAPLLKKLPVNLINADDIFDSASSTPQVDIYREAFNKSSCRDFHALMFLDIDEFWVPINFSNKISDICSQIGNFDTISFQWKNKLEREILYGPAIDKINEAESAKQLKTLYRSYLRPERMNPHNVLDDGLNQRYENGKKLETINEQRSQCVIDGEVKNAFILHRKERSEFEYIATLLRGRPVNTIATERTLTLKSNRHGFKSIYDSETLIFDGSSFENYRQYMDARLNEPSFKTFVKNAKLQVDVRYKLVLEEIYRAPSSDTALLKQLLTNVSLPEVRQAFERRPGD